MLFHICAKFQVSRTFLANFWVGESIILLLLPIIPSSMKILIMKSNRVMLSMTKIDEDVKYCYSYEDCVATISKENIQPSITCSHLIIETLEHGVKYVQI